MLVVLVLALLAAAGAQARADQAGVTLDVLGAPFGLPHVQVTDLDANPPATQFCENASIVCHFTFSAPRRVRLTAPVEQEGIPYRFYGWSAAECPSSNVCDLQLTGDDPVISAFPLYDPERILVSVAGSGTVSWPGDECVSGTSNQCTTADLPAREPIVFTATPTDPNHPIEWAYGCEPISATQCSARPENRELGVGFNGAVPDRPFDVDVTLRVGKTGDGDGKIVGSGFNCGSGDDCRKLLPFGKIVSLEAQHADGSRFDGWVGVCGSGTTCRFNAGPVSSVKARFVAVSPPPPPSPPQPPPPPKLQVRITKLTAFRKAKRWRVTARITSNKPVSVRARVGRGRRTWGDRTVSLRAGTSSLTLQLTRRAKKGRCWFALTARTTGREVLALPRRTVKLGR
jgi:hypothetical protein